MAKRLRRVEQALDTRRRLLDAARRVFVRRGFHAASLDLVAEDAGFTKGAVYSRFRSKADLFLALLERRIEERIADFQRAAAGGGGPAQLAGVLATQWDERLREDLQWSMLVIEFRLHAARMPPLNRRYAALHERLVGAFAEIIAGCARKSGRPLAAPAEHVARVALTLGTGVVLERCADGGTASPGLAEAAHRALVRGLIDAQGGAEHETRVHVEERGRRGARRPHAARTLASGLYL